LLRKINETEENWSKKYFEMEKAYLLKLKEAELTL